jgi:hypothetical protein
MPWRKPSPSSFKRNRVNDREYEKTRRSTGALAQASALRRTTRWQKCREIQLYASPMCCDPFDEHQIEKQEVVAEQVHHKIAIVKNFDLCFDPNNHASVCTRCHARLESMEKAGRTKELENIWHAVFPKHPQQF